MCRLKAPIFASASALFISTCLPLSGRAISRLPFPASRGSGESYAKIAAALSISENTVKSYCRRNNIAAHGNTASDIDNTSHTDDEHVFCKQCGHALTQEPKKKPRRFCSKVCCATWWAKNPDRLNKKATYSFKCATCGINFSAYGNKGRKYCSHKCYIARRFGKGMPV